MRLRFGDLHGSVINYVMHNPIINNVGYGILVDLNTLILLYCLLQNTGNCKTVRGLCRQGAIRHDCRNRIDCGGDESLRR